MNRKKKKETSDDDVAGAVPEPIDDRTRETLAVTFQRDVVVHTSAHQLIGGRHTRCNCSFIHSFDQNHSLEIKMSCYHHQVNVSN